MVSWFTVKTATSKNGDKPNYECESVGVDLSLHKFISLFWICCCCRFDLAPNNVSPFWLSPFCYLPLRPVAVLTGYWSGNRTSTALIYLRAIHHVVQYSSTHMHSGSGIILYGSSLKSQILRLIDVVHRWFWKQKQILRQWTGWCWL